MVTPCALAEAANHFRRPAPRRHDGLRAGTSSMLIKFMSPETLTRFGGPERFADAVEQSLYRLAEVIGDAAAFRHLLFGD
jgi:hypothetical protein